MKFGAKEIVLALMVVVAVFVLLLDSDKHRLPPLKPVVSVYLESDSPAVDRLLERFAKQKDIRIERIDAREVAPEKADADLFIADAPNHIEVLRNKGMLKPFDLNVTSDDADANRYWYGFAPRKMVLLLDTSKTDAVQGIEAFAIPSLRGKAVMARSDDAPTAAYLSHLRSRWGDDRSNAFFNRLKRNEITFADDRNQSARAVAEGLFDVTLVDEETADYWMRNDANLTLRCPDREGNESVCPEIPHAVAFFKKSRHPRLALELAKFLVQNEANASETKRP